MWREWHSPYSQVPGHLEVGIRITIQVTCPQVRCMWPTPHPCRLQWGLHTCSTIQSSVNCSWVVCGASFRRMTLNAMSKSCRHRDLVSTLWGVCRIQDAVVQQKAHLGACQHWMPPPCGQNTWLGISQPLLMNAFAKRSCISAPE